MAETVALVSGANKGIGKEVARRLVEEKMRVFVGARDAAQGEAAAKEVGGTFVQLDVSDNASVEGAIAAIEAQCGRLDVVVNNAGVLGNGANVLTADLDDARTVIDVNVFGAVRVLRAAERLLRASPAARVVNVSSELGSVAHNADPSFEFAAMKPFAYNTSKAALNMTTVLASHALPGVKVNAACPGYTDTDLNEHSGHRTVQQAANVIVRLATLPDDGPSGRFFNDEGPLPW
mmetsp:Transcript_19978/g.61804  ORF Transcript_19978/g.61804 Transcript_19978/m.61804 type:complete len:234 (+) Transcript_19978:1-702(+)